MKLQKSYIFKKESQRGIASLIVVLALTVSSIAVLGGGVAVNLVKLGREPASNVNKLVKDVEDQLGVLNEKKVANSFFDSLVVGTVLLPDGSFSAYKFIDGGVDMAGSRFTGSVNISYLSGDRVINYFSDEDISPFYLKDGRITSAQFLDRMIATLVLNDGVSYAIKIHQGNVRDGRLIGNFVGQTYDSGFLIAGTVDEDGKIANIVVKPGAQKTTETESTIAKNAISLFQTISKNSAVTKVLGISDYQTVGFNKPVFDIETGTWIFAGDTQGGSVTSTPVQTAVNYIQNFAQSLNNGDIFQQTAQVFQGIKEVRSGSPELSINTIDDVAEFTIDLSNVSLVIKDGDVGTGKISDGAVTVSKLSAANSATNGSCLTYDSTEGKFRWGGCGSSGGGTITGITAGNGLTGGGTTGVLSLAVSVATEGGLESNAGGVSLLTTCSPDEILKWDGSAWICATDAGGVGGGVSTLQLDDVTVVSSATTVDFLGSDFDLTNSPAGEGNLSIDYTNSKITRRDQAETITASWNFSSAPAISAINNTGVLTLPTSTDTLIGRNTSDTLTNKTIAAGNNTISGLSVSNFSSANISQWTNNSGYLTANQTITLSGDVSGTGTTSITTTIGSGVVTLGKMANLAANSIIGNNTGSPAAPAALTAAQVKAMLGITTSDVSGLGTIATQSAGNVFITGGSLSGLTSVSATTFTGALTGNATSATTATTANALANTDSAGQSAITAINSATAGTINTARLNSAVTTQGNTFNGISQLVKLDSSGNLPALNGSALTGLTKSQVGLSNVENTALSTWAGSTSLNTIADKTVTLAKMADMATSSFLGRSSVGSGAPEVLSISTVKTMLSLSTSDISGLGTIATQSAANVSISGGNISGVYRINGADISGGSLSGTSVNGVTTANILLSTGSYSDPSWITSLSPTKVLPDQTGQNGKVLSTNGSVLSWITNSSGVAWGAITGTLSDQTDLNSALSGKLGTGLTSAYIFVGNGSGIATGVSMSGDVAIDNTGLTTIGSGKVSLSKMANLAANSIIGNNTGSPATPLALSASDVKTLLAIANTDVSGLGTIATQSAGNVFITGGQITGGTINGVVIGGTTASAGTFTTLSSTGNTTLGDANSDTLTIKAGSSGAGITFFDSSFANCSALETVAGVLTCGSDDTGAGGGIATIQVGDSDVVTSATTIDFLAADFDVTNSPTGEGNVSIDYTNSKITRSDQTQSVLGAWTFSDLTVSDTNVPLTGASLTLDFNNALDRTLTITNTNTGVANLSVEGTINGSTITGGSLSGTAVNGITTANILLSTGSYSNPSWLSGLTASHLTAGDFSTAINSGTYSINVSGSAGSATTATTANALANTDAAGQSAITAINSATVGTINSARIASLPYISTSLSSGNIIVGNGSGVATAVSMSGDITIDNLGATTIGNSKVTLSKIANIADGTILGNNSGIAGAPSALTASQVKTLLSIANTDVSGLGTISTQNANNVSITGGSIDGATIGGTTRSSGNFTTLDSNGNTVLGDANTDTLVIKAGSSGTGITFFDSSFANCSALETVAGVLTCGSDDTGAGGGVSTIKEGGTNIVTSALAINYAANDFVVTDETLGVAGIAIDYTNSKITRSDQTQSITGAWTFSDLTVSDTNVPLTGASLTLDFNNALDRTLTITNSNTGTANLSVEGTINGSTITGGSLSGTAVNGVTTANILLSTGSYSNPGWLSGLTASHLTAGDFSSAVNSGTYSINVSGSAGSVTGLSVTSGKTLTVQKSMTFTAADDTGVYTLPTGTKTLVATDVATLSSLTSIGTLTSLSVSGAISGATATNTINGLVINSGALSNATTLALSGAITAATATNTINGIIINSGAVSNVSTLGLSGAITGATATNTINGIIINAGAVSGVTTLGASSTVTIGSGGNTFTFNPASGPVYAGTAMPTKRITLTPEYAGATLTGDGTSNTGTMTSDTETASPFKSYYNWSSTQGTAQDYDVWIKVPIPSDFSAMASTDSLTVEARSDNLANTAITIVQVYDTANAADCTTGNINIEPGTVNTWADTTPTDTCTGGTYAADGIMTIQLRLSSLSNANARVGRLYLQYKAKF